MLNQCHIQVICRKELTSKQSGQAPISIVLHINKKRIVISLNIKVEPVYWDIEKRRVKKTHPGANDLNLIIDNAVSKATAIFTDYRLSHQELTTDAFKDEFINSSSRADFIAFWKKAQSDRLATRVISLASVKQENVTLRKLQQFKSQILFNDINSDFIKKFDNYIYKHLKADAVKNDRTLLREGLNSRGKYLKHIKTYIKLAIASGIRIKNPFENKAIKVHRVVGNRESLTSEQLNNMYMLYKSDTLGETDLLVIQKFLLSCFTGLRISDIKILNKSMVNNNILRIYVQKNKKLGQTLEIPLNATALELFNDNLFKPLSEPEINLRLKAFGTMCGVKKKISMHWARHTFASLFLQQGGRVEVLQQLLGHTNIATTMIYVHIAEQRKREQISLLDSILESPKKTK